MSNDRFEAHQSSESRMDRGSTINAVELQAGREKITVNADLHDGHANAIETHLNAMSKVDTPHTQETVQAAKEYNEYKTKLIDACFDNSGNIRPEASDRQLQQLYDVNRAEVEATTSRIGSIKNVGSQTITQARYEGETTIPTSLG